MDFRRFSQDRLELCEQWFAQVKTDEDWKDNGSVGEGESKAIHVENASGLRGVAKPGVIKTDGVCRSAHEKIAFDLGHILQLPVSPVILWDRGGDPNVHQHSSISAWAFASAMKWNVAAEKGLISDPSKNSAAPVASAMRVFHTWIGDSDRKLDHIQVDLNSPEGQLGVAFIDHAYSMSHGWKGLNCPGGVTPQYVPVPEHTDIMEQISERIVGLEEAEITRIVNRVPPDYLPEEPRGHIIGNLLTRRAGLLAMLGIKEGDTK